MRTEVFYSDLYELVEQKELVSDRTSKDKWLSAPYDTADYSGVALFAGESCAPKSLALNLNVTGWYKIYLCIAEFSSNTFLEVGLSDSGGKSAIMPSHLSMTDGTYAWSKFDFAEEVFYKAADLTGQKLIINKPREGWQFGNIYSAALLSVRLVPMTDGEVDEYCHPNNSGRIAYHFDSDYMIECDYRKADDYLGRLEMFHDANGDLLIHECEKWDKWITDDNPWYWRSSNTEAQRRYVSILPEINKKIVERAHEYGMKALAGCRIEAGDFVFPHSAIVDQGNAVGGSDTRIRTREGRYIAAGSYAYKSVRTLMIDSILARLPENWDGVSVFLHRGILVGFEEPTVQFVKDKYGVDARRLPYGDARLTEALCAPMTEFFKELRIALDKRAEREGRERYIINAIGLYSIENSLQFGYDFEEWARLGLIDSMAQGLMGYKENIDGLLADDGLLDLDKYREAQRTRHVFVRNFGDNKDIILNALPGWLTVSKKYSLDFYATMPWEFPLYSYHLELAKALYEAGAEKLICWNANHSVKRLDTAQAIKDCGDKQNILAGNNKSYRRLIRMYSICGNDISTFCVNWNG